MIDVSLISMMDTHPLDLTAHAAKTCYESNTPEFGKRIDVDKRLFSTGHHTTLQHSFFTFHLSGLSVSSVTFGLHLASPYYNTDQRSGRFSKMYDSPDFPEIEQTLKDVYRLSDKDLSSAIAFIKKGTDLYAQHIDAATKLCAETIPSERPHATEKYIEGNAKKIAQEQLRVFVPMIAPTALDYTVNLSALCALYRSAFSPEMRFVVQKMVDLVTEKFPDLAFMFKPETRGTQDFEPALPKTASIKKKPECRLLSFDISDKPAIPVDPKDAVDLLYFTPEMMNNSTQFVKTNVTLSGAAMGQDQRHRSIRRAMPIATSAFYLPPLLAKMGLEETCRTYMQDYLDLDIPVAAKLAISPYGAMFSYDKLADLNALAHEQQKRLCWCAQEEIFHLSLQLRDALLEKTKSKEAKTFIEKMFAPHCVNGKCLEGVRYCGRTISNSPFITRQI